MNRKEAIQMAKREMEAAVSKYQELKDEAGKDLLETMAQTGKWMSLADMADFTGLPPRSAFSAFDRAIHNDCDSCARYGSAVDSKKVTVTKCYALLRPDGSVDRDHVVTRTRKERVYRVID